MTFFSKHPQVIQKSDYIFSNDPNAKDLISQASSSYTKKVSRYIFSNNPNANDLFFQASSSSTRRCWWPRSAPPPPLSSWPACRMTSAPTLCSGPLHPSAPPPTNAPSHRSSRNTWMRCQPRMYDCGWILCPGVGPVRFMAWF